MPLAPSPSHHHFYRWYAYSSQMDGLWHCFTHIIRCIESRLGISLSNPLGQTGQTPHSSNHPASKLHSLGPFTFICHTWLLVPSEPQVIAGIAGWSSKIDASIGFEPPPRCIYVEEPVFDIFVTRDPRIESRQPNLHRLILCAGRAPQGIFPGSTTESIWGWDKTPTPGDQK